MFFAVCLYDLRDVRSVAGNGRLVVVLKFRVRPIANDRLALLLLIVLERPWRARILR